MATRNSGGTFARGNTFDFLRLLAALSVLVHHSVIHLETNFFWHSESNTFWFYGGVPLFFILSGMMIFQSAERCHSARRPWRDFYQNRALRIMPAIYFYWIVSMALLVLIGALTISEMASPGFIAFAASNLFLIPVISPGALDSFGVGVVNGSLWTIPVEVSFYLIVPLFVLLLVKSGRRVLIGVLALLSIAGLLAFAAAGGNSTESVAWKLFGVTFAPYLWYFAIGIFWSKAWPSAVKSGWIAAASAVTYLAMVNIPAIGGADVLLNAAAAIPLSYAAVWFGYNGPRALSNVAARIGDLSFSTYIWHMIVVNVLIYFGARDWEISGTVLVMAVAVLSMLIAAASWWFIEKSALSRKRYSTGAVAVTAPSRKSTTRQH